MNISDLIIEQRLQLGFEGWIKVLIGDVIYFSCPKCRCACIVEYCGQCNIQSAEHKRICG